MGPAAGQKNTQWTTLLGPSAVLIEQCFVMCYSLTKALSPPYTLMDGWMDVQINKHARKQTFCGQAISKAVSSLLC